MQKFCCLILSLSVLSFCVSACTVKQSGSMIKSKRRFVEYIEPVKHTGIVDLSEGPKLRYDANFGPHSPEFDIKIKNPY